MISDILVLFLAGFFAGAVNVIAGAGSMISISAMIFLGTPGPISNATNRVGLLIQNLIAVMTFYRRGFSDARLSLSLSAFTIPGAILGALVAAKIRTEDFKFILVVLMLGLIPLIIIGQPKPTYKQKGPVVYRRSRVLVAHLCMIFIGLWGGFIGIGTAFVLLPMLNRILFLDYVTANMHKVTISLVYTSVALITFITQLNINWAFGFWLSIGMFLGALLGTNLQIKHGHEFVKWILVLVVIGLILSLL